MPECVFRRAVKLNGIRHEPGDVVRVSDAEYAQLVDAGVAGLYVTPAAPPPVVRIPRTPEEKQAALAEAQARVAKATDAVSSE